MRIDVHFTDRVGIAQEILSVLAVRALNVVAVEVDPPHIYIDVPDLSESGFRILQQALRAVDGVQAVTELAMLPGVRRRLYLDALMRALADPVLAVDHQGVVQVANGAAEAAAGVSGASLVGQPIDSLLASSGLAERLADSGYHLPPCEVELGGESFLLETVPLAEQDGRAVGAVATLHAPHRLGERLSALQNFDAGGFEAILGESPPLQQLKQRAARMAAVDAPLLITGETGTGKELIAHACHTASSRNGEPFFALNCAAVPENLAESELFGYAPGAFSGALRSGKPGLLELADGGTVFLDEIGEMSPYLQAKLLRFLNDGRFRRDGGDREIAVDVRIISATHRQLEKMVAEGAFRQDLLFRLNVLHLDVPPLRARPDDILPLARHFVARACAQAGQPVARLTGAASAALLTNPWPGNVRQLQNVIFRAVTMAETPVIDAPALELAGAASGGPESMLGADSLEAAVAGFEKALLSRLYLEFPSTRLLARRLATSHSAIAMRLRKYGIGRG